MLSVSPWVADSVFVRECPCGGCPNADADQIVVTEGLLQPPAIDRWPSANPCSVSLFLLIRVRQRMDLKDFVPVLSIQHP